MLAVFPSLVSSVRKAAVRAARDVLGVGVVCLLLPACVLPPAGYPYEGSTPYSPYGPAAVYPGYPLPPPVPPGGAPVQRQPYYGDPGYRPYDAPPAYRPDGQSGRREEYRLPEGPGIPEWPTGEPDRWNSGYGRDQPPSYRSEDGVLYGRPRRNRLDDPEPSSPPDDLPSNPGQPGEGSPGLGQPMWR